MYLLKKNKKLCTKGLTNRFEWCIIRVTKEIEKKGIDKMIDLQVTFFHKENKYKPISTIIKVESLEYYKENSRKQQIRALENIAHYRRTTPTELIQQGFTQVKVREYNKQKIEEQKRLQHRINLLKKIAREREERKKEESNNA